MNSLLIGSTAAAALVIGPAVVAQAAPVSTPSASVVAAPAAGAATVAVTVASAQVGASAPQAPLAAAKGKKKAKKPSPAKFAKKVNAAAKKKVRAARVTSALQWSIPVKSTKKRAWWVSVSVGKGYRLGNSTIGNSASQATVTAYRKAVMATLKRNKLKPTGTVKFSNQITKSYAGSRYVCSVGYTVPSRYGVTPSSSFWCTTRAKANAAVKRLAPFEKAYRSGGRSTKGIGFSGAAKVKSSASAEYRAYKKTTVGIGPVEGVGGFSGYFGKAPGKSWRFVLGVQAIQNCSDWEATQLGRRAWAGLSCWRGDYSTGYEDKVRAW
ncbi:hypothetical protein [Leucobacter soli]|nr:hypothetical protein [Leucobacter soli]